MTMGYMRFRPDDVGTIDGVNEDTDQMVQARKGVTKYIYPIVIIVSIFLGILMVSMVSQDWYVAEALGCPHLTDELWSTAHFGLNSEEYDLSAYNVSERSHIGYEGRFEEESYHHVAWNFVYSLMAVIGISILFMFLVTRMENSLQEMGGKLSYIIPPIVGTAAGLVLMGGLLYFYGSFEAELDNARGSEINWATAGYGWPIWGTLLSGIVLFFAVALSYWCGWRAIHITNGVVEEG